MPSSSTSAESRGGGWVAVQVGLIATIFALGLVPPRFPEPLRVVGVALAVAGAAGFVWSARVMGRSLTPFPRPRRGAALVERGPFAVVRHPVYATGLVAAIGYSLFASVPSLLATAVLAVFWDRKARDEERRLAERFPGYDAYRARVRRRFVPGLW